MVNQIHVNVKPGEYLRAKDAKKPEIVTSTEGIELTTEAESDAIECPICLAPGFERKCCGAFYCNEHYHRTGRCPNCDTPCIERGFTFKVEDPGDRAIGYGWGITHSLTVAVIIIVTVILVNEGSRRWTVTGYECYKWYDRCDMNKCIDLNNTLPPYGLTSPTEWYQPTCAVETSVNKVRGASCVFDPEVYRRSGHALGYDLCWGVMAMNDEAMGGMRGNMGHEFDNKGAKFTGGAYVFEDDFEAYTGSFSEVPLPSFPQASALWGNGTNAEVSNKCGGYSGSNSLRFSGSDDRWAVTAPLDLQYGGFLNFRLKFAPEGSAATEDCNSAFIGNVDLYYAAEEEPGVLNNNFTKWKSFIVTEYPLDGRCSFLFTHKFIFQITKKLKKKHVLFCWVKVELISLSLPKSAWSAGTRFMFDQAVFVDRMDHFAIDDMHVFHKFKPKWDHMKDFQRVKRRTRDLIEDAKCCLGSAQCSRRISPIEKKKKCAWVPGFTSGYDETHEPMNATPPLYIFLSVIMFVARFVWAAGNLVVAQIAGHENDVNPVQPPAGWCSSIRGCCSKRLRASAKIYTLDEGPPANMASERRFFVDDDPVWRFGIFLGVGTVPWILISWYYCIKLAEPDVIIDMYRKLHLTASDTSTPVTIELPLWWFVVAVIVLDAGALWYVAKRHIFATWSNAVPAIDVDARPSRGVMTLSGPTDYEEIKLTDFKTHHRISARELQWLGAAAIVGCWPFASVTLLMHVARIPWPVARVILPMFGSFTMVKAYVGGDWLLRGIFWFDWFFSRHLDDREELGARTIERRNKPIMRVAAVTSFLVGLTVLLLVDFPAIWKTILFLFIITMSGTFWGFLCGVAHGLPVEPRLILTSLKEPGIILRYQHNSRFSLPGVGPRCCRHPSRHVCVDVHSRDRLLILSTDDDQGLYEMLKGITQGELTDF
eukprot:CAMPEP_0114334156 /NCGR_PEP_ID=MMETSP0101-20121206/4191_1 /TAXON_ID=38822 ORGANISM="Pteridomonas danica, Strain PT" /NCGR_SAMPLE_ID=MMETSP0101 /ASSEMBLY_ACC=CAM_ASM_000211 /LENGTH=933 /DNA_ID=CAMNT_0001465329 /DNA_START=255 /DNA_END=3061 /DNA_ORIENTATION=-